MCSGIRDLDAVALGRFSNTCTHIENVLKQFAVSVQSVRENRDDLEEKKRLISKIMMNAGEFCLEYEDIIRNE